ncbi:MAG TPA: hypothetical protein VE999_07065 [Gemmataceae bacterium]|nr:hypothetical protein [Gemmataceae bacterium]
MRSFWLAALAVASMLLFSELASACVFHNPDTCGLSGKSTAQLSLVTPQLPLPLQYSGLGLLGNGAHLVSVQHDGLSEGRLKGSDTSFAFIGDLLKAHGGLSPPDQVLSALFNGPCREMVGEAIDPPLQCCDEAHRVSLFPQVVSDHKSCPAEKEQPCGLHDDADQQVERNENRCAWRPARTDCFVKESVCLYGHRNPEAIKRSRVQDVPKNDGEIL